MEPADVVRHFGSQSAAANAIGVTKSAVSQWVTKGKVPERIAYKLQVMTGGRLVVDESQYRRR